jgi:hypothetical protein
MESKRVESDARLNTTGLQVIIYVRFAITYWHRTPVIADGTDSIPKPPINRRTPL